MNNIRYILAQCKYGQKKLGVDLGPKILINEMQKGFTPLGKIEHNKKIYSSISARLFENGRGYRRLYHNTKEVLEIGGSPIILGGDHSISSSTVPAFFDIFRGNGKVLWIDAHADINTPETSPSGNLHGMPVASFMGFMEPIVKGDYIPSPDQIIYVGVRDKDPEETKLLDKLGISCYKAQDIFEKGNEIKEKTKDNKLHISFDVDCMDPSVVSSTGTPVKNGITTEQIKHLVHKIDFKNVKSLDFVEYNPFIDGDNFKKNLDNCINLLKMFH